MNVTENLLLRSTSTDQIDQLLTTIPQSSLIRLAGVLPLPLILKHLHGSNENRIHMKRFLGNETDVISYLDKFRNFIRRRHELALIEKFPTEAVFNKLKYKDDIEIQAAVIDEMKIEKVVNFFFSTNEFQDPILYMYELLLKRFILSHQDQLTIIDRIISEDRLTSKLLTTILTATSMILRGRIVKLVTEKMPDMISPRRMFSLIVTTNQEHLIEIFENAPNVIREEEVVRVMMIEYLPESHIYNFLVSIDPSKEEFDAALNRALPRRLRDAIVRFKRLKFPSRLDRVFRRN